MGAGRRLWHTDVRGGSCSSATWESVGQPVWEGLGEGLERRSGTWAFPESPGSFCLDLMAHFSLGPLKHPDSRCSPQMVEKGSSALLRQSTRSGWHLPWFLG